MATTGTYGHGVATALLVFLLVLLLITFIVSIIQLYQIRKITGYSTNLALQNAYDFSIGVLIMNLFALLFIIGALVILIHDHFTRSASFTTLVVLSVLVIFGGIIVCGFAAGYAGTSVGSIIGNLITMIVALLVGVGLLFYIRRYPPYIPPAVVSACAAEGATVVEEVSGHEH